MTDNFKHTALSEAEWGYFFPPSGDVCRLLVSCNRSDYSASLIARAVEDCDAQLLNLNVTSLLPSAFEVVVDLRVNIANGYTVARSLERYGFTILDVEAADDAQADKLRQRANEVLRYLEI